MNFLIRLFRRETSSNEFIPEIDGLRFLAIAMVVLFHLFQVISDNSASLEFTDHPVSRSTIPNILLFGYQGVQLFFVISGFVLAMPFMRFYLGLGGRKILLKEYFLRRLTRLEPPYIISLIGFFLLAWYFGRNTIEVLVPSLFWSLFYLHNIAFPGDLPYISGVTWSLEIEVQYYILAPLITWAVCCIRNKFQRRLIIFILIIVFAILSWFIQVVLEIKTISLALYLQYFFCGILLCDLYLLENKDTKYLNSLPVFVLGLVLLSLIVGTEHTGSQSLLLRLASPLIIFGFYAIVFWHAWWRRIFRLTILTLIGGMCYTIYLLHHAVISTVARHSVRQLHISEYYLFFLIQATILLLFVVLISSMYFLLIEKPCMKKNWPSKLYEHIKYRLLTDNVSR